MAAPKERLGMSIEGVSSTSALTVAACIVETLRRGVGAGGSLGSFFLCDRGFNVPLIFGMAMGAVRAVGVGWDGPDIAASASKSAR